jgi:enoyl-CoA hydratase
MQLENILLQLDGRIATLTLNRPRALNALNRALLQDLSSALDSLAQAEVDVVILTGAGEKSFVAGADISEMKDMTPEQALEFARLGQGVFQRLHSLGKVSIAAVNGFALGGGCELAIACDLILASESARFGQPEVNLGVIPGFGGTQRLARLVGPQAARYLVLSGDIIDAREALRIGLAAQVYPAGELLEQARKLALTISSRGQLAVRSAREVIAAGLDVSLAEGLELEAQAFSRCFETADQKEGMDAFLGRRKAVFSGR